MIFSGILSVHLYKATKSNSNVLVSTNETWILNNVKELKER